MTIQEFYSKIGGSYDSLISRVGTDDRAKKFILMFANDQTMAELTKALNESDIDTAFRCAHTMKGLAANLSFDSLQKVSSDLTEILRHYNGEDYSAAYKEVVKKYDLIISNIKSIG